MYLQRESSSKMEKGKLSSIVSANSKRQRTAGGIFVCFGNLKQSFFYFHKRIKRNKVEIILSSLKWDILKIHLLGFVRVILDWPITDSQSPVTIVIGLFIY